MKLIIAIVHDTDYEQISQSLINANFRVTRVSSTGGFLRRGSSTLMIGVSDDKVDEVISLIRDNLAPPVEAEQKRASLFVIHVEDFTQF